MNHQDYIALVSHIEDRYRVSDWNVDGVSMWPVIRIGGRSELARMSADPAGNPIAKSGGARRWSQALRMAASPLAGPLENLRDWRHEQVRLGPADALILGDSVSADMVDGSWRDRYGEPVIRALEELGGTAVLMQPARQKLPRHRATYSAQWIDSWGRLMAQLSKPRNVHLPDHGDVLSAFEAHGLNLTVLDRSVIARWGLRIACMARLMDHVLARTRPKICMTVSYYWDMGYAFNLACRRRGILSVDIQHGAQDGRHEAYNLWKSVPAEGYCVMPAIFWTWTPDDARDIEAWAGQLRQPWHRALPGGHPQLGPWLDDSAPVTRDFDARIAAIKQKAGGSFDILVALQDVEGYGAVWENLARVIRDAPPSWRWWLRRHPSPAYDRGAGTWALVQMQGPNIMLDEASKIPLPALLRNVDAVLSLMSSTAVEASFFGHKAIFLTENARMQFSNTVGAGKADIIPDMEDLSRRLTGMAANALLRKAAYIAPDLRTSMQSLLALAQDYRTMARQPGTLPGL